MSRLAVAPASPIVPPTMRGAFPPETEGALHRLMTECAASHIPRSVLVLRLSLLPPGLTRPQHRRLAQEAIGPLAVADRARLFALSTGDLAVSWRGEAADPLRASLAAVAHLFAGERVPALVDLAPVLTLPAESARLLQLIGVTAVPRPASAPRDVIRLDAAAIGRLQQAIAHLNLDRFLRRRQVRTLRAVPAGALPGWETRSVDAAEVTHTLAPGVDLSGDPGLARLVQASVDRRLLTVLAAGDALRHSGPCGLRMRVGSILSPEFLALDASLPRTLRGKVMLELTPADVLDDLSAFVFARDFARMRGYRLLLRGMSVSLLDVFPLDTTGFDLLGLTWSPDLAAMHPGAVAGWAGRAILSCAGDDAALAWAGARSILYAEDMPS